MVLVEGASNIIHERLGKIINSELQQPSPSLDSIASFTMEVLVILLGTLSVLIIYKLWKRIIDYYTWRSKINKIPGPELKFPFIGTPLEVIGMKREDRIHWLQNIANRYKNGIYRLWVGTDASIQINNPEYAEIILRSTKHIEKSFVYKYVEPWLGKGLLTSTGEKWHHDRKLITPAFHFGILEDFAEVMVEKAHLLNRLLAEEVKRHGKEPFNVFEMICRCALDIICETAMGVSVDVQSAEGREYSMAIQSISTEALNRMLRPWLKLDCIYYKTQGGKLYQNAIDTIHSRCIQVIEQKQAERRKISESTGNTEEYDEIGNKKRRAFLDLLLEASENTEHPLTIEEIRDQVNTFMFAGHDTTAALMSWCLFSIGNDETVQRNVHQELDEVFGDSDEPTTTKQVAQLKYLERVIKETLRLYPSAPTISRKISEDLKMGDYTIPADTQLTLQIYQLHRDPKYWPNATSFDPDRFLPENSRNRHPYAFVPFSGGPRNCIGQKFAMLEAKIVLTEILRKWRVKSRDTHETVTLYNAIILRPHEGIFLNLSPKK